MTRTILLYGCLMALLTVLLKAVEYHFFARHLSLEIYLGVVALLFMALGVWVGIALRYRYRASGRFLPAQDPDKNAANRLGISPRELDVLQLMARGYSNQEIAAELFISLNTVKTHSSNLFAKLDVKRRTQAVQRARELDILPGGENPG